MQARRILLVEDDPDTLALTSEVLQAYGFEVMCASTVPQARELLHKEVFEVVLADLFVGSHDVAECWRGVRSLRTAAGLTPLGLVTASRPTQQEIVAGGVAFVLQKPFSSEDLLEAVAAWLSLAPISTTHEQILRSYFSSIERSDWDQMASLCSPSVVYHVPGSDPMLSRTVHGRAALRAVAMDAFQHFAEPRFGIKTMRSLPDGALVRYDGSWLSASGQRERLDGAVLFRIEAGQIAEIGVRLDLRALRDRNPPSGGPDRGASFSH